MQGADVNWLIKRIFYYVKKAFVTPLSGKFSMRTHNSNILALLIISTLLVTFSCTKNSATAPVPAPKASSSIAPSKKLSPMEDYISILMETVRQYWGYASAVDEQLSCTVDIEILPDGEIVSYKLTKSSGNRFFDNSALNAIVRTQRSGVRLPPPEPLPKGITIIFNLPPKAKRWPR